MCRAVASLPPRWCFPRSNANRLIALAGRGGPIRAGISGSPLEEVARDLLVRASSFITTTLAASNITAHVAVQASNVAPR